MRISRRAIRVAGVLGIAAAAGHLVQQDEPAPAPPLTAQVAPAPAPALLPEPTHVMPVSAGPTEAPVLPRAEIAAIAPQVVQPALPLPGLALDTPAAELPPLPGLAEACPVTLTLAPQANAMIGLALQAPCHADERVVLQHAGLAITEMTGASGLLSASLPALDAGGSVTLRFGDGTAVTQSLAMPEVAGMRRFAVQWQDRDSFQLHGFENGADYGQPGHVWAMAPNAPLPGVAPAGGYLTALGNPAAPLPMLAQVYTFPAGKADVVIEAEVTEATCGRELLGETLVSEAGRARVSELNVAMPGCEAKGDILVLRNLAEDMKIAAAN